MPVASQRTHLITLGFIDHGNAGRHLDDGLLSVGQLHAGLLRDVLAVDGGDGHLAALALLHRLRQGDVHLDLPGLQSGDVVAGLLANLNQTTRYCIPSRGEEGAD